MGSQDNFSTQLLQALDAKASWFDTVALPKVLENYRLHSSCVQNLLGALIKKSIINADPYKHDKKISNIIKNISMRRKLAIMIGVLFIPYAVITAFLLSNMVRFYDEYNIIGENISVANKYNIEFKENMDAVMYQMVIRSLTKDEVAEQLGMKNPDDLIANASASFEALKKKLSL